MKPSQAPRPFGVPPLEALPDPAGKRALVRATLDRPLSTDPTMPLARRRAEGLAATVRWLLERGAEVTVWGSDGDEHPHRFSARTLAVLQEAEPWLGSSHRLHVAACAEDADAVAEAVAGHDLYVNDSLQDSLLPVPSVMAPPSQLPSAAGRTLTRDLSGLFPFVTSPRRPFVAVLGGAGSIGRLHNLEGLVLRADAVLLGGALSLPMRQALGREAADGDSELLWECRRVLGLSQRVRHRLVPPEDLVWSRDADAHVSTMRTRTDDRVVDIGPSTCRRFGEELAGARSVLWAGSVGRVEDEAFREGTRALARALPGAGDILLGGDALVELLEREHLAPVRSRTVTATDAAIELLKDGDLPALAALRGAALPVR